MGQTQTRHENAEPYPEPTISTQYDDLPAAPYWINSSYSITTPNDIDTVHTEFSNYFTKNDILFNISAASLISCRTIYDFIEIKFDVCLYQDTRDHPKPNKKKHILIEFYLHTRDVGFQFNSLVWNIISQQKKLTTQWVCGVRQPPAVLKRLDGESVGSDGSDVYDVRTDYLAENMQEMVCSAQLLCKNACEGAYTEESLVALAKKSLDPTMAVIIWNNCEIAIFKNLAIDKSAAHNRLALTLLNNIARNEKIKKIIGKSLILREEIFKLNRCAEKRDAFLRKELEKTLKFYDAA